MKRYFNQKEKQGLYIAAGGRCEICNTPLSNGWHADHNIPFSKGGKTDIINGQALCPECNAKKGGHTMLRSFPYQLRDWQQEFYERYFSLNKVDFLAVATPGSGKTIGSLRIAHQLFTEGAINTLFIVCPSDYLRTQWIEEADKTGIPLTDLSTDDWGSVVQTNDFMGIVTTYAQIANSKEIIRAFANRRKMMVIGDEIHHCGDDLTWGAAFEHAFYPATRRLLLSGTPFRTDDNRIPFVDYLESDAGFKSKADFAYGYGRALMDHGVVRPIVFPTWNGQLVWMKGFDFKQATFGDDLNDEDGRAALRTAVRPDGDWIKDVITAANTQLDHIRNEGGHSDAAGLIVASDTKAADQLARVVEKITGEMPAVATSSIDDAKQVIERFRDDKSKWLVAVKMVSEGVDIKRLRVGVYATTTATRVFFYQVIGRVIRWINDIKQQPAYFYFPMYAPLVRYMKEIQDEIDHVIRNHEATWEIDRRESGAIQVKFYQFVDSKAIEGDTVYLDYEFTQEQLQTARRVFGDMPGLRDLSDAELALAYYRARGEEPKKSKPEPVQNIHISTHRRKEEIRRLASKSANRLGAILVERRIESDIGDAIKQVNTAWGKRNGFTRNGASIGDFERKAEWCNEIAEGVSRGDYNAWYRVR